MRDTLAAQLLTRGLAGSTGIVPLLTNHVLGITPLSPGFTRWSVRPVLGGGITWAAGCVPTSSGEIRVRWESMDQQVRVHISAPPDTMGTVAAPLVNGSTSVSLD